MPSEDIAVRLADTLDAEDGGRRRLLELARRLGCTEAAVRRRAWGLQADRHEPADLLAGRYVNWRPWGGAHGNPAGLNPATSVSPFFVSRRPRLHALVRVTLTGYV